MSEKVENKKHYPFIAYVSFKDAVKVYTFGSLHDHYYVDDLVVVETVRGQEIGKIMKPCEPFIARSIELKPVIRKASDNDLKKQKDNEKRAEEALVKCTKEIERLKLEMNLIEASYTLDGDKLAFVYVAEERVDFRDLLKSLAQMFKCRIELRQVGPRNKAKMVGGLGCCGMETCCSRFLNDFDVVSINMAKNQLLALNIQKLSGQCGKLMCCLKYEDEQYKKLREGMPKIGSFIEFKGEKFKVASMNLILQQVKLENRDNIQFLPFKEVWPDRDFDN